MKMTMDVRGLKELDDLMRLLPAATSRNVSTKALRLGARVVQRAARNKAPRGPEGFTKTRDYASEAARKSKYGSLRNAIVVKTDAYKGGTIRRVVVVVSNKGAGINPYWIEYGTVSSRVSPRGGLLTFVIDGKLIRKRFVRGVKADPFMRPAADESWQEAIEVVRNELAKGIVQQAERLGTRVR